MTGLRQGVVQLQRALQQAHKLRQACSVATQLSQRLLRCLAGQSQNRPREIGALEFMMRHTCRTGQRLWNKHVRTARDAVNVAARILGSFTSTKAIEMESSRSLPRIPKDTS